MAEEVKVNVSAPGAKDASDRIKELAQRIKELRAAAQAYEDKGIDSAAKSARQDAARLEKDIANFKKEGAAADKEASRERARAAAEEKLTESRGARIGRGLITAGAGVGIGRLVEAFVIDAFERQGIANRGAIGAMSSSRVAALMSSFRGSSGAAFGATEEGNNEIFNREQNRVELARKGKQGIFAGAATGVIAGAGAGAAFGSLLMPGVGTAIGAGVGAAVGGVTGGVQGYLGGKRNIAENEQEIRLLKEKNDKLEEARKLQFGTTDAQQIAGQKARIAGHFAEANAIGMSQEAFARYKELRNRGASEDEAKEGAGLTLRQRGMDVMRGLGALGGARDGRANLAALSSLGSGFSTGAAADKLNELIGVVEKGNTTANRYNHTRR